MGGRLYYKTWGDHKRDVATYAGHSTPDALRCEQGKKSSVLVRHVILARNFSPPTGHFSTTNVAIWLQEGGASLNQTARGANGMVIAAERKQKVQGLRALARAAGVPQGRDDVGRSKVGDLKVYPDNHWGRTKDRSRIDSDASEHSRMRFPEARGPA